MNYSAGISGLLVAFIVLASASQPLYPYKVYGDYAINWNAARNTVNTTFLDGGNPALNVTFNTTAYRVIAYPSFILGWHYYMYINPIPNVTILPRKVSAISEIPAKLGYQSGGSRMASNFACDLFLRDDQNKTTPKLEIMIWSDHNNWPLGSLNATKVLTTGGCTFDLWEGYNSGAGYYVFSFVPSGTVTSIGQRKLISQGSLDIDIKVFLNWLQENKRNSGNYNDNMYLHAIEAGFEIVYGNGWVYFTDSINTTAFNS